MLGVPGLMRAYRAGTVALANAVGTGVADDKAIYNWVAEMIRFYLGEEPLLDKVRTYLMSDPEALDHALERMDELVVKPRASPAARASSSVRRNDPIELAGLADAIRRSPEKRIAQELVNLSTVPTADEYGNLAPRHVDLRPFAVFGETISIVPAG